MSGIFSRQARGRRSAPVALQEATLREFSGGWNSIDNDISLSTRFAVELNNLFRYPDGTIAARFGSNWLADVKDNVDGDIVDVWYFNGSIIAVTQEGEIAAVTDAGVVTTIWNETIANALVGAPTGWSDDFVAVDFVDNKSDLIIHNGIDKPIIIHSDFDVEYLNDPATGSNLFTPIGKYGCTVADYHVVAGIPAAPTEIYITSKGTSGVFPGDAAPNDSISLDIGAYSPQESSEIIGVAGFRQSLLVFFAAGTLVINLGTYDSDLNHVPEISDLLPRFGLVSHRVIAAIENDLLFQDIIGTNTARRNVFTNAVESERTSELIAPDIQRAISLLTDAQERNGTFAVYDRLVGQYIMFLPTGRAFVLTFKQGSKGKAWSEYNYGKPFTAACSTYLGHVVFARGSKLFLHGNTTHEGEEFRADYLNDRDDDWRNGIAYTAGQIIRDVDLDKSYTCLLDHTSEAVGLFADDREGSPNNWEEYLGDAIDFAWELPWSDAQRRMKLKQLRYLNIDTIGTAEFTINLYVDGLYKDASGIPIYDPALTFTFISGNAAGFGGGEQPFGGGRRTLDVRLWSFPANFKQIKARITGSTRKPIRFVAISFLFAIGNYKR